MKYHTHIFDIKLNMRKYSTVVKQYKKGSLVNLDPFSVEKGSSPLPQEERRTVAFLLEEI